MLEPVFVKMMGQIADHIFPRIGEIIQGESLRLRQVAMGKKAKFKDAYNGCHEMFKDWSCAFRELVLVALYPSHFENRNLRPMMNRSLFKCRYNMYKQRRY